VTTGDITAWLDMARDHDFEKEWGPSAGAAAAGRERLLQLKRRQARLVRALPAPRIAFNANAVDVVERQAQLPPTAESVLAMLLPAVCTFWPCELACS
jgi:hypothetical protein